MTSPAQMARPWLEPVLRSYRRSWLWRRRHRRPVQAFGLGTAKSGTHSIARVFSGSYQALHEWDFPGILPHILDYTAGRLPEPDLQARLRARDRANWPVLDVAHYYGEIPGVLARTFPDARFVVTIRDCFSWLASEVSQVMGYQAWAAEDPEGRPEARHFLRLHQVRYEASAGRYGAGDEALRAAGVPPVEAFLTHWAAHNARILDEIPAIRRLVVRTPDIKPRLPEIARFLNLPPDAADAGAAHAFKSHFPRFPLADYVDPAYVDAVAERTCARLMRIYFPDHAGFAAMTRPR